MFSGESLATVLHALALRRPDEAIELIKTSGDLEEELRSAVLDALLGDGSLSDKTRRLGDELRAHGADRGLTNECYRVAFYTGNWWQDLADNPLFAFFSANRAGAALDKWIHYFPIYTHHLERYRRCPVRVLEIGVYRGGGLALLRQYLGDDAIIVGLDIDEAARDSASEFVVEVGDQQDPGVLRQIHERHGPFDVVIDDGGHAIDQQIVSAETLFPLLSEGGTYIVEDCHTSYWPEHEQYAPADPATGTFMDWVKARMDDLNAYHYSHERTIPSPWGTHLDSMHVYDSVVVLKKAYRFAPFSEVSGLADFTTQSRQMAAASLDLLAAKDLDLGDGVLRSAVLSARDAAIVRAERDELKAARSQTNAARLSHEVGRLEQEVADLKARLEESWSMIQRMRRSRSWRFTAPLRRATESLREE